MLRTLFLLLINLVANFAEVVLDIREVTGKSQSQVARYLGVPLSFSVIIFENDSATSYAIIKVTRD